MGMSGIGTKAQLAKITEQYKKYISNADKAQHHLLKQVITSKAERAKLQEEILNVLSGNNDPATLAQANSFLTIPQYSGFLVQHTNIAEAVKLLLAKDTKGTDFSEEQLLDLKTGYVGAQMYLHVNPEVRQDGNHPATWLVSTTEHDQLQRQLGYPDTPRAQSFLNNDQYAQFLTQHPQITKAVKLMLPRGAGDKEASSTQQEQIKAGCKIAQNYLNKNRDIAKDKNHPATWLILITGYYKLKKQFSHIDTPRTKSFLGHAKYVKCLIKHPKIARAVELMLPPDASYKHATLRQKIQIQEGYLVANNYMRRHPKVAEDANHPATWLIQMVAHTGYHDQTSLA